MKARTSKFKEQIMEMGREIDSKITYNINNEMIELGAEELNSITPSFQGSILKSVMKQLVIDSNVEIPKGTEINYKFGLKIDDNYEYLNYGNYIVENCTKKEDTLSYEVNCYDKMLLSMKDYEDIGVVYPITIREYIKKISQHLGLAFFDENKIFTNYNKQIPNELYLDQDGANLGYTFRDVLDEIAQVTASTICINENNQLEIRYINETNETINEEFLKDVNVNFGEKYGPINSIVLSRSGESDNVFLKDDVSIEQNGLTEIKIVDNQIMNDNNRADYLPEIYNALNGFEYYINDFSSTGIGYLELCDKYNVEIYGNTYPCVLFNDELLVTQGLQENIYTEIPEETETDYKVSDSDDRKINQAYIIVNKQNQTIEAVVSQVSEQNEKVAKVTQTVEELNSKIGDLADITTSLESTNGKLEFDNINQSEPIRIVIRPIGESISYLYPSIGLYPSDTLYPKTRTLRFHNKTTDEYFDLVLPDNVLYYNDSICDEFILDYDGLSCVINKKVGYNADGSVYVLDTPKTIDYEYPHLEITDGDYEITLLGYDNAYIFTRLMAQNIYTTQFATKAEVNSEITQTTQAINLSVDKKLESYSTTTEMNAQIQITANEINQTVSQKVGENEIVSSINNAVKNGQGVIELKSNSVVIESDNFTLNADGEINSTSGKIGGWTIQNSELTNGKVFVRSDGYTTMYTVADIVILRGYLAGLEPFNQLSEKMLKHYDLNDDGVVNILDLTLLRQLLEME